MKVLITGGAGFIGSHLAFYHVQQGDQVILLDNFFKSEGAIDEDLNSLLASPAVQLMKVDMTLPFAASSLLPDLDIVYHLAAINGTSLFYEIPYQVARTNLLLTLNLLDALGKTTVRRLVYASTSEVYADSEPVGLLQIPTNEKTPVVFTQPTNDRFSYGTSKFMGEFLCLSYGRQSKLSTSVVRYHNVYGPRMGNKHVISEFIQRIHQRETPFKVYGGDETRAFCYVSDAVKATALVALTPSCNNEVVHIGNSAEEIRIADLAQRVMDQLGFQTTIIEQGRRSASVSRRCPDTSKLFQRTGFKASVSLNEGLEHMIAWQTGRATAFPKGSA